MKHLAGYSFSYSGRLDIGYSSCHEPMDVLGDKTIPHQTFVDYQQCLGTFREKTAYRKAEAWVYCKICRMFSDIP